MRLLRSECRQLEARGIEERSSFPGGGESIIGHIVPGTTRAIDVAAPRVERPSSQVFDPTCNFPGFANLPHQNQVMDDLADRLGVLGAVGDSRMFDTSGVEPEEVLILRKQSATLGQAVSELTLVGCSLEPIPGVVVTSRPRRVRPSAMA